MTMYRLRSPTPSADGFVYRRGLPLSRREQEILWLMCRGLRPYEIAERLCRSHHTIHGHLLSIRQKTGCRTLVQLGAWWSERQQ